MADLIEVREKRLRLRDPELTFTGPSDSSVTPRGGRGPRPPRVSVPAAPETPRSETSPEVPSASPSEPEPPTIVEVIGQPITGFVGPQIGLTPFTFIPTVEVSAKRVVKKVAKRTARAALIRVARLLIANPIVAGTIALLFPTKANKGETEFLEAYYGRQDPGGLPEPAVVTEIEVRAPRLRIGDPVPAVGPAPRVPARTPSRNPTFTPYPTPANAPSPDPEAGAPRTPARPPSEPADPFAFDPDEDDIVLIPRVTPKPLPRVRVPLWPFQPSPIGPDGPIPLPVAPGTKVRPGTRPRPIVDPVGSPSPTPIGQPFPDPVFQPTPGDPVREPVRVPVRVRPGDVPLPLGGFTPAPTLRPGRKKKPSPIPGVDVRPDPAPAGADPCNCAKPKAKQKERKNRDVCYRGTYVEKSRGLIKHRKEEVPCR